MDPREKLGITSANPSKLPPEVSKLLLLDHLDLPLNSTLAKDIITSLQEDYQLGKKGKARLFNALRVGGGVRKPHCSEKLEKQHGKDGDGQLKGGRVFKPKSLRHSRHR